MDQKQSVGYHYHCEAILLPNKEGNVPRISKQCNQTYMTQQAWAKRETSAIYSLPVLFLQAAYSLMGTRCIEGAYFVMEFIHYNNTYKQMIQGHLHMTSNQSKSSPISRYLSDNVVSA